MATKRIGTNGNDIIYATPGARYGIDESYDGLGGNDTVSYKYETSGVIAGLGSTRTPVGDVFANIENLTGSNFNDSLSSITPSAVNVENIIDGGKGDDTLFGDNGDYLIGGEGTDVVTFAGFSNIIPGTLHSNFDSTGKYVVVWNDNGTFFRLQDVEYIRDSNAIYARNDQGLFDFTKPLPPQTPLVPLPPVTPPTPTPDTKIGTPGDDVFQYTPGVRNYFGQGGTDTLVISGSSNDYGLGPTLDGKGFVVWKGSDFAVLNNMEKVQFTDQTALLNPNGTYTLVPNTPTPPTPTPVDAIYGQAANDTFQAAPGTQNYFGRDGVDTLVINGNRGEYGISATLDGKGFVVWQGSQFDVLNEMERVVFNDQTVTLNKDGTFSAQIKANNPNVLTGTGANDNFFDRAGSTQYYFGDGGFDQVFFAGKRGEYGIAKTLDGQGLVVWKGADFDILTNIEAVVFSDIAVPASNYF